MSSCGVTQQAPAPVLLPVPAIPHLITLQDASQKWTRVVPDRECLSELDWSRYKGLSFSMTVPEVASTSQGEIVRDSEIPHISICLLLKDPPMNLGGLKPKVPPFTSLELPTELVSEIQSGEYQDSRYGMSPEMPTLYREGANIREEAAYWVDLLAYLFQTMPVVLNDVSHSQIYLSDNLWITPSKPVYPDVPALFLEKGFVPTENSSDNIYKLALELGIVVPQELPRQLFSSASHEALIQWLVFQYQASLLDSTWKHGVDRAQDMRIGKNYSLHENILKLLSL